jgi:hypothetical protein
MVYEVSYEENNVELSEKGMKQEREIEREVI